MISDSPSDHQPTGTAAPALAGHALVAVTLLLLAAFLGYSYFDGRVRSFLASYYIWLTPVTALMLFLMAGACLVALRAGFKHGEADSCDSDCERPSRWQLLCVVILIAPIVFGLVVNPRQFSPEGLRKRRLVAPARDMRFERAVAWVLGEQRQSRPEGGPPVSLPPNPTVADILAAARADNAASLEGRFVTLVGQCDLLGGPDSRHFDLYRLVVTCCIADASAISLEVARPNQDPLEPGTWIRAAGILKFDSQLDPSLPVLHATTVSRIPEPSEPYL